MYCIPELIQMASFFTDIGKPKIFNNCYQVVAINNAIIFLHLTHVKFNLQDVLPSGLTYSTHYDTYLEELEISSVELKLMFFFKVIHTPMTPFWQLYLLSTNHSVY